MTTHSFATIDKLVRQMIYPFYLLDRDMQLPVRQRPENDAEHSWSLALAACALAPHIDPTLDLGKVAHFAIVHDLVEVYSGDVSIFSTSANDHADKEENERRALSQLEAEFSDLPWIHATIAEYETKESNEARYVWSMDKYLALYMRLTHAAPFFEEKNMTKKFFDVSIARMHHKSHAHAGVGELVDQIIAEFDAHPEWFVQKTYK